MKKTLLFILFAAITTLSFSQSTITGTLAVGPTYNRPLTTTSLSGVGTAVYYTVVPLTVTAPGTITISCVSTIDTPPDSYGCLYSPAGFIPATPLVNILALDDDGGVGNDFQITYNFPSAGTYYIVVSSFTNGATGTFTLTSTAGAVLPVTISSFTAVKSGTANIIRWETANEINIANFIIQRSNDGVNYSTVVASVAARNSSNGATYSITDANPRNTVNYYRIKTIDQDGSFKIGRVAVVNNLGNATTIAIYPNPAAEFIVLQLTDDTKDNVSVTIVSSNGKNVLSKTLSNISNSAVRLAIPTLAAGTYYIKVTTPTGTSTLPFVKN